MCEFVDSGLSFWNLLYSPELVKQQLMSMSMDDLVSSACTSGLM